MEQEITKQKIISYIDAAYKWHEAGEGSLDEGYGKSMGNLEEEILTSFGLPFMAVQYSEILQVEGFSIENKEKRSEALIETLTHEAEKYLLAPIEKDTKTLAEARSKLQDAVEVLPMIGITTTPYNCFLYYDIFFREIYNENEILLALRKNEELDELPETRIPHTYEGIITYNNFERLNDTSLPFLNEFGEFLKYKESKHNWDEHISNDDLGEYMGLPDIYFLNHFFIKSIQVEDANTSCIIVLIEIGEILVDLKLWCETSMVRIIMLHAKYYSLAVPPLYVTSSDILNEGAVKIPLKTAIGKNIEIENINIEIEKVYDRNGKSQDPFEYVIATIDVNENISKIYFQKSIDDLPF